jgi:hypothetical protein
LAGDFGVGFGFRRGGEGLGEVVEPGVGAATGRFFVDEGEQWALPELGDVCAIADHAGVGIAGAPGNVPVLGGAVSSIGSGVE